MNIKFEPIHDKYVDDALDMVIKAYHDERKAVPCLPVYDFEPVLRVRIENFFSNGTGVVAINENAVIGFLAGFEVEEFFGKCKGVYGHGAKRKYQKEIYQKMYQHTADMWVKKSLFNHAITLFAHDDNLIDTWFWLGFGLRCIDAIREVAPICENNTAFHIKKTAICDIPSLTEIYKKHNVYYRTSPLFMPNQDKDPIKDLTDWLEKKIITCGWRILSKSPLVL